LGDERSDEYCHHAGDIHVHIGEWFDSCESNGNDRLHADSNRCRRLSHLFADNYCSGKRTSDQFLRSQSRNYPFRLQQHAELGDERSDEYCHHAGDIHVHIGEWFDSCKSNGDDCLYPDSNRCRRLSHFFANHYRSGKRTNDQLLHTQPRNYHFRFQQHAELDDERSDEHCHHAGDIQVHIGERFHERKSNGDDRLHADSNRCRRLSHLYANRYG